MNIRDYTRADREGCLALLRSNLGVHFVPEEETAFAAYLDAPQGPYYVVENDEGRIVAGGGIAIDEDGTTAALCWGIVSAELQRGGIGTALTLHRLDAIVTTHPEVTRVRIETSQKVQAFYEKHGFEVAEARKDGYGPGLDHVTMFRPIGTGAGQ